MKKTAAYKLSLIIYLILFSFTSTYSQVKIELTKNKIIINSNILEKNFKSSEIFKILGSPSRKHPGVYWVYDDLGIYFTFGLEERATGISIFYCEGQPVLTQDPNSLFKGRLILSGYDIVKNMTVKRLQEIPNLKMTFSEPMYFDEWGCDYNIGVFKLSTRFDKNGYVIKQVNFLLDR